MDHYKGHVVNALQCAAIETDEYQNKSDLIFLACTTETVQSLDQETVQKNIYSV
jgi:hypothetical protein